MDGILLVDKPGGITSHDVVAFMRRTLGERSIGHTGTLDPLASGLLPLVVGRATRLSSLLMGRDKTYDAEVRLGWATDTDDSQGTALGAPAAVLPGPDLVRATLNTFVGTFDQLPPRHSAKRVDGVKAYELARRNRDVALTPVPVTVRGIDWQASTHDRVRFRVTATAGFYVRSLARELGERLGCGAHLSALRRVRSGVFAIEDAVTLADADRLGREGLAARLISPAEALPGLPAVVATADGLVRVRHGNPIGPAGTALGRLPAPDAPSPVRILDADGHLVALATLRDGALHPVAVLG